MVSFITVCFESYIQDECALRLEPVVVENAHTCYKLHRAFAILLIIDDQPKPFAFTLNLASRSRHINRALVVKLRV
jgi:hypothetical protein